MATRLLYAFLSALSEALVIAFIFWLAHALDYSATAGLVSYLLVQAARQGWRQGAHA